MRKKDQLKKLSKKIYSNIVKKIKSLSDEDIFKLGVVMLPFENFFFAPSSGWATISPIIFFIYMLCNYKFVLKYLDKYKKYIIVGVIVIVLNLIISLFTTVFNIRNIINVMIPILLGITVFISLNIYYEKNKNLKKLSNLIFYPYVIALIVGIIEYFTIKLELNFMYEFFDFLFKRNYLANNRVQFFFTEPSFIGMHLFGVLLPYYLFTKEKRVIKLIIAFVLCSFAFSSGVRILLDVLVVILIFVVGYMIRKKMFWQLLIVPIIGIAGIALMYNHNYRVQQIVDKGIYADGSLASRYFRVQSSVYGYLENPLQTLIGYGMGNSIIPLRDGYDLAKSQYKSTYVKEVNELGNPNYYDDSVSYCLYTRFVSEFGLIVFICAITYIIKISRKSKMKYKYEYLLLTAYLYLQFESYAFYALWIFILAMLYTQKEKTERERINA